MPKTKTKGVSYYKKQADKVFSEFIRLRDADEYGRVSCCTCPKIAHWKEMTCGHWISRGVLATRYDESNCHPQCWGCQAKHLGNGKAHVHEIYITLWHGEGERDRLLELSKTSCQMKVQDYKDIINKYKNESPIPIS
jgi:hypothetical protein